jgi:thymidylate synthase (FAD)
MRPGAQSYWALEEILYQIIPVLDHGFIRVVDYMGNDAAIVQAARVSYGTGTRAASDDRTLRT